MQPKNYTPRQAINAKCKECIYDSRSQGTWKEQVETCTSPNCPLFELRPVTQATQEKRKLEKISTMTPEQLSAYRKKQDLARKRFSS